MKSNTKQIFRYLMLSASILSIVSCQLKLDNLKPEVKTVAFDACFADNNTKTSYKDGGKVNWVEGDAIRYYTKKNGEICEYEVPRSGHSTKVLAEITAGTAYMIAAYGGTEITDNGVTSFTLKGAIKETQSGKFEEAHVSVAKTFDIEDGSSLTFHNMTSLIKFSLTRTDVAYATFKATAGESLHGNGTLIVSFADDQPSVSFGKSVGSSIRVNTNGAGEFYISTLPVELSKGFSISLYDSKSQFLGIVEEKNAVSIGKDVVYNLGCLDGHAIVPVTEISLSKNEFLVGVDSTATLTSTVLPANATFKGMIWSSSDNNVATVDKNGVVTGKNDGKCTITASSHNGKTTTCTVYVCKTPVITKDASKVALVTATLNGSFNVFEAESVKKKATFLFSDSESTIEGLKANGTEVNSSFEGSDFSSSINNLRHNTNYHYIAILTFLDQIYYGEVKNFTTASANITAESSNVSYHSARISGKLTVASAEKFAKSATLFYSSTVSTIDDLKSNGKKTTLKFSSDGSYYVDLSSLASDNKYNYVVVSKVDEIEFISDVKSFTTLSIQAFVTAESLNVSSNTATISGKLTVTSEGPFNKSAVLYYSTTASTLETLKSSGTMQTIYLNSDGTYSDIAKNLVANKKHYYCVIAYVDDKSFVTTVKDFTTQSYPTPQTVDLGLSVKWSSFNVGASKPEEYGKYFAWGDVIGQTWDGSKWSGGGFFSYPHDVDINNNLKPEYDVARVSLVGSWRMPTKAECQELQDSCTATWTSNYNDTGVAGRIFTSKKDGYTDKFIFVPAAGGGEKNSLFSVGSYAGFWSSSIRNSEFAYYLFFRSESICVVSYVRSAGLSVRAVSD